MQGDSAGAKPDVNKWAGIDMCDPKTHDDPWDMLDYFRENEPLYWDPNNEVWYVFRYDDIVRIERDPETFCSGEGARPNLPPDPGMIYQDGEQHTKQRALVSQAFTPRQMRKMEDRVHEIVDELVSAMLQKDECDIVADLAAPLPARLIADMLGVDPDPVKRAALFGWINTAFQGGQGPQYVTDEVNDCFEKFAEHHEEMMEARKAAGCKGEDILSIWMRAEINGEKLDESQLLFEHVLLTGGGGETTRNAIAGGLEQLVYHPDQYDYLYDHPEAIPNAAEEIIRWVTPFHNMFRTATRDVEMHGKVIKQGQQVGMQYPAANRDPRHFKDPYTFDIRRDFSKENSKHLSFGLGKHFCLGASLARLELATVLTAMTQKVKRITIPEGKAVQWFSHSFIRGPKTFPALLEKRTP